MKYVFLTGLILLASRLQSQTLKEGDNIKDEFKKITNPFYFRGPLLTEWAEGLNMILIGAKSNPKQCDYLFIATSDTTLVGVFKQTEGGFMFDEEGNSILGKQSQYFLLPLWIIKNKTRVSSSDIKIITLLDKLYEKTLQSDDFTLDEETAREYNQYRTDTSLANRHIAFLFDTYQSIITDYLEKHEKPPVEFRLHLINTLAAECVSLYKKTPVVVCIYIGETLLDAGMEDKAREHFKMSLQFYPNSIPLLVYDYRLEQDSNKKKQKLNELKKKYPKHWMVKDL